MHEQSAQNHVVSEPFDYLIKNTSGKDIRSKMIDAFNVWYQISPEQLSIVKAVVSKLHNASLLFVLHFFSPHPFHFLIMFQN